MENQDQEVDLLIQKRDLNRKVEQLETLITGLKTAGDIKTAQALEANAEGLRKRIAHYDQAIQIVRNEKP